MTPSRPNGIPWQRTHSLLLLGLLIAGAGIRLVFFFQDRPVWVDEAGLALNVIDQPWKTLTGPLDITFQTTPKASSLETTGMFARQTTPLAYLAELKIAADAGHGAPRALRVPALAASLLWLAGLAWWVRGRPPAEGLAIFAAIAFSRSLIVYSTEIKQYGTEAAVAFALQAFLLAHARPELWTKRKTLLISLAGAAAVWCAFGSVMVLAGCGLVLAVRAMLRRDWASLARLAGTGASWAGSFAVYYFTLLRANFAMQSASYQFAFPPAGISLLRWLRDAALGLFENPMGFDFRWAALGLVAAVLGAIILWKRDRTEAALVLSPVLVTIAMSAGHLYPWSFQLVLFLAFSLSVLLGTGIAALAGYANSLQRHGWALPIGLFALAWIASAVAPPLDLRSNSGFKFEDLNKLVISIQKEPGPARIFLTHSNALVCRYYQKVSPRKWDDTDISALPDTLLEPGDVATMAHEITTFAAGRECWVVLSRVNWPPAQTELLIRLLDPLVLSAKREQYGCVGLKFTPRPAP